MGYKNDRSNFVNLLKIILAPLFLWFAYELFASGKIKEIFSAIEEFATGNRYIFYPILGAVVMVFSSIRKIGVENWKKTNHPIQGVVGAALIGGLGGVIIARILTVIFR